MVTRCNGDVTEENRAGLSREYQISASFVFCLFLSQCGFLSVIWLMLCGHIYLSGSLRSERSGNVFRG